MNPNTWISFVTTTIGAAAAAAVTDGIITGRVQQAIISAAGIMVPFVWGWFIHRDSKVVQTAATLTGGFPIPVGPNAPASVKALAADRSEPLVVTAVPADAPYSPYATSSQRGRT